MWAVVQIATFRPTAEIIEGLKEHWKVSISEEGLRHYRASNPHCPTKWREMAERARAEWNAQVSGVPIANAAFRLQILQETLDQVLKAPVVNRVMVMSILEQAAKDAGGSYTNRRDLTTAGEKIEPGGSVYVNPVVAAMDLDAAGEAQLREVLRKALEPVEEKTPKDGAVRGRRSPSKS